MADQAEDVADLDRYDPGDGSVPVLRCKHPSTP